MSKYIEDQLIILFNQARENGGIEYLYTLLRVTGIGEGPDELIQLYNNLETYNNNEEFSSSFKCIVNSEELYELLVNLVTCSNKGKYALRPFLGIPNEDATIKPTATQIIQETVRIAKKTGKSKIADILKGIFTSKILHYLGNNDLASLPRSFESRVKECCVFAKILLNIYFQERLKFSNQAKVYKLPRFEVLELLADSNYGLYGFYIHFSNDTFAYFIRYPDNTDCLNMSLNPISFMVGSTEKLKNEWRMNGRRLYEIGLLGRYNELGEWKPLVYPVNTDNLQAEALSVSDNSEVQGAYFYMLCTGHKVVEFVVSTTLELPRELIRFGDSFHLRKCPTAKSKKEETNNLVYIYDGWVELKTGSVNEIEGAINGVGLALNIIGFTYNVPINWRVKYKMHEHIEPIALPTEEDLKILDTFLKAVPYNGTDAAILSYSIDWYVKGRTSRNVFLRFLSYYISFESIAIAIADGDANFGLDFKPETKSERKERTIKCILHKFDTLYNDNPVQFVERAYFECVISISKKIRNVAELIFGAENSYINLLFKNSEADGLSLNNIRGRLAHGGIALFNNKDERLVRRRIHDIETIAKEFIIRVILNLEPSEPIPSWSYDYKAVISSVDPRSTLCTTDLSMFPKTTDWKIRMEWCE